VVGNKKRGGEGDVAKIGAFCIAGLNQPPDGSSCFGGNTFRAKKTEVKETGGGDEYTVRRLYRYGPLTGTNLYNHSGGSDEIKKTAWSVYDVLRADSVAGGGPRWCISLKEDYERESPDRAHARLRQREKKTDRRREEDLRAPK